MSTSKFSNPFMMKNPLSPLKGNAFIKAKMDAETAGKSSFTVDGKNYPLKMNTPLEKEKDPREKVKDTIRVSNKYKPGDYVEEFELEEAVKKQTGKYPQLSAQDYSTVKKDKKGNYITKLTDSPVKNIDPKKKKAYQDSIQKLHKPAYDAYVKRSKEGFYIDDTDGAGPKTFVKPRTPKSLKDFAYDMEIGKGGSVTKDGVPASKLARMYK